MKYTTINTKKFIQRGKEKHKYKIFLVTKFVNLNSSVKRKKLHYLIIIIIFIQIWIKRAKDQYNKMKLMEISLVVRQIKIKYSLINKIWKYK